MNEKIIELQNEERDKLNKIINEIEGLNYLENIANAYTEGYVEGGKIRNLMIGKMLETIINRNKDPLDLNLELKEFIEELLGE